jgi:hypothetical protein
MKICCGPDSNEAKAAREWSQIVNTDPLCAMAEVYYESKLREQELGEKFQMLDESHVNEEGEGEVLEAFGPSDPAWS